MFEKKSLAFLEGWVDGLEKIGSGLPDFTPEADLEGIRKVMALVVERMRDNLPYAHPLYVGQMLKPPHPVARLAYTLSLSLNPNNHSLEVGRASSEMEKEAVAHLAQLFGWETHLGHLCGGGTLANLEALWISSQVKSGRKILASSQAHYTHERLCHVLGIPFQKVDCNSRGQMDLDALKKALDQGNVGTVVATLGTTQLGAVDPLNELLTLKASMDIRIHADAAYGGYFTLCENLRSETRAAYESLRGVDSIVVDPHKHGLQPYGCGCVLFHDPTVVQFYKHDSPYTYFSSSDLHLGEIGLECSRPGASAVALWATQQLMPCIPGGQFAQDLSQSRKTALELFNKLKTDDRFLTTLEPELDILVWGPRANSAERISRLSKRIYDLAAKNGLHLALTQMPSSKLQAQWKEVAWDQEFVTLLRSCFLKSEHLDWLDEIWNRLSTAVEQAVL